MNNQTDVPKFWILRRIQKFVSNNDLITYIIIFILVLLLLIFPVMLYKKGLLETFVDNENPTTTIPTTTNPNYNINDGLDIDYQYNDSNSNDNNNDNSNDDNNNGIEEHNISNIDNNVYSGRQINNISRLNLTDIEDSNNTGDNTGDNTVSGGDFVIDRSTTPESIKIATDYSLSRLVNKFKSIDIPIIINNSGKICRPWDAYQNGIYTNLGNKCAAINTEEPNQYYCINTENNLISCNNYITPSITQKLLIDTENIVQSNGVKFMDTLTTYNNTLSHLDTNLSDVIGMIKSKGYIANNQDYFNGNNKGNMNAKKELNKNYKQIYDNNTNNVNIQKENIIHYQKLNEKMIKSNNNYYKILKYVVIILIVFIIINFALSKA